MWRRFSLWQAVVLVIVLGVAALLVAPMFAEIGGHSRRSACRANLHNIGLGLGQWQADNDQAYPALLEEGRAGGKWGIWERLVAVGYVRGGPEVFVCPTTKDGVPVDATGMVNSSYGYDNGRIPGNAAAGRIVMADCLQRLWASGRWPEEASELVKANHDDGANVLYDDKAAVYIKTTLSFKRWIPQQAPGLTGSAYDFVRQGVVQNTRIQEDVFENAADEHDDAFAIEYDTGPGVAPEDVRDKWRLLTDWEFETGLIRDGDTFVPVPKSKTDASVQPMRGYRHGTGWPSTGPEGARDIQTGGPRSAPAVWEY
jgi:hypothetical protein